MNITVGSLVTNCWTYQRRKIKSYSTWTGMIVSEDSEYKMVEIEKLKKCKDDWEIEIYEDYTEVLLVLSGKDLVYMPVCNLTLVGSLDE